MREQILYKDVLGRVESPEMMYGKAAQNCIDLFNMAGKLAGTERSARCSVTWVLLVRLLLRVSQVFAWHAVRFLDRRR